MIQLFRNPLLLLKILTAAGQVINFLKRKETKQVAGKFAEILVNALANPISELLEKQFTDMLQRIEPDDTRRDILISFYVPVDSQLERLAAETKTPLDDAGVRAMKRAIETVAARDGVTLPNVDND
jgi:hypothetical protein